MKKVLKKAISLLMAVVICLSIAPLSGLNLKVSAATQLSVTQEQAVSWALNNYQTVTGAYGTNDYVGECISLVKRYIRDGLKLGGSNAFAVPGSSACRMDEVAFIYNNFTIVRSGEPKPGDIFVWDPGVHGAAATYGHVGIITSTSGNTYNYVDWSSHKAHSGSTSGYTYLVRPYFKTDPSAPKVRYSNNNGKVTFSWDSYAGSFDYYYLRVYKDKIWSSTVKTRDTGKNTSATINLGNGHYVAYIDVYRANEVIAASSVGYPIEFDISLNTTRTSRNNNIVFYSWPAHPGAQSYNLRVKKVVGDQWVEQEDSSVWGIKDTSGHVEMYSNGTYIVYAEANTADGVCAYSTDKVDITYVDPKLSATVSGGSVKFTWTPYSSTDHYRLRIYKDKIWNEHVATYDNLKSTSYNVTLPSGSYAALVECMNSSGSVTHYGSAIKFTVNHTHSYTSSITTQPTCTGTGVRTYKCSCGKSYTESVAAKGHSYTTKVTAPTCTEKGYTTHTCSVCKSSYIDTYVNAKEHIFTTKVTVPTCTENGYTTNTCSVCNYSYKYAEVAAKGHTYTTKVTAPTCTEKGYTIHTCSVCNYSYKDTEVAAKGHTYTTKVTAPTCTEKGYTTHTCSVCNYSYKDTEVAAKGHSYTTKITAPTCTEKGYTTHTCSVCNYSYKDTEAAAKGHSYTTKVTAPTCTEKGYTTHTCTVCKSSYTDTYVNATGHKDGSWKTVKSATVNEEGLRTLYCAVCNKAIRSEAVPKIDKSKAGVHSLELYDIDLNYRDCVKLHPEIVCDEGVKYTVKYYSSDDSIVYVDEDGYAYGEKGWGRDYAEITCIVTDEYGNTISDNFYISSGYAWWQWIIGIALLGFIWY